MSKLRQSLGKAGHVLLYIPRWIQEKKGHMAMAMAYVAVLGAAAAFCAGRADQRASRLESTLSQGRMLELNIRQKILDRAAQLAQLKQTSYWRTASGWDLQHQAEALRRKNPQQAKEAALLDLKAEEQFASVRTLHSFIAFTWEDVDLHAPTVEREKQIDKTVSQELPRYGFETLITPEAAPTAPTIWRKFKNWVCSLAEEEPSGKRSMWYRLEERVCDAQLLVWRLTSSIAVFVGGLVFFTFALLNREKSVRVQRLTRLGCLMAVAGIFYACGLSGRTWLTFLLFSTWLLVLPVAGILCASQTRLETSKTLDRIGERLTRRLPAGWWQTLFDRTKGCAQKIETHFELRDDDSEGGARVREPGLPGVPLGGFDDAFEAKYLFGRRVLSWISITALLSAVSALLYTTATIHSDHAASKSLQKQAEFFRVSSQQRAEAFRELKELADTRNNRVRYWAAQQRLALAQEKPAKADEKEAKKQLKIFGERLKAAEKTDPDIWEKLDGGRGPDGDPYFPNKLLAPVMDRDAQEIFAESDGENEISLACRNRATAYLRAITLFAIALYLFGQALSMGRIRAAFMLAVYAVLLVGGGIFTAVAGVVKNRPPSEQVVRDVATHFADGMKAYKIRDYAAAINELGKARGTREKFALANYYYSVVSTDQGTSQTQAYISQIAKPSLPGITRSEERGIKALTDQDLSPPLDFLLSHGFEDILLGLSEANIRAGRKDVDHGIRDTKKALERLQQDADESKTSLEENEEYPLLEFNLGTSYFANHQEEDARKAFDIGLHSLATMRATYEKKLPERKRKQKAMWEEWQQIWNMEEPSRDRLQRRAAEVDAFIREWNSIEDIEWKVTLLAAGAISGLHTVQKYCVHLNDPGYCSAISPEIETLRTQLARMISKEPPRSTAATISEVHPVASVSGLGWRASFANFDTHRDVVSALWYECEAESAHDCDRTLSDADIQSKDWKAWRVLPQFSGAVNFRTRQPEGTFQTYTNSNGMPDCLPNREYRARIFLNGKEIEASANETRDAWLNDQKFEAADFQDVNLSACYPADWKARTLSDTSVGSLARGFTNGDETHTKTRGVFLFTFYSPGQDPASATKWALQKAVRALDKEQWTSGAKEWLMKPLPDSCKIRLDDDVVLERYKQEDTTLYRAYWVTNTGMVDVGFVLHQSDRRGGSATGPGTDDGDPEDCDILTSIRQIYTDP